MATNQTEQDQNLSENQVLDEIIGQKHGGAYHNSYDTYGYEGQSLFQRYISALGSRQPVAIAITLVPVAVIILSLALASGGKRSNTEETPTDTPLSSAASTDSSDFTQITRINDGFGNTESSSDTTSSSGSTTTETTLINTPSTSTSGSSTPTSTSTTPTSTPTTNTNQNTSSNPPQNTVTVPPIKDVIPNVPAIPIIKQLKLGKLCSITGAGLNEASGLASSMKHPGVVYTHNDEAGDVLAVRTSDCKVVARITISKFRGGKLADPEAISIDHKTGKVWLGDIGNGHPGQTKAMTDKDLALKDPGAAARIITFDEPSKLSGKIKAPNEKSYDITYQGGMQNSEALLVNPKTGQGYLINKQPTSTVYKLPNPLKAGEAKNTNVKISGYVTDATFTSDGKYILVRYRTEKDPAPKIVYVYDANWKQVGKITVPKVKQGESITADTERASFVIGSEGENSPLVRIALPSKFGGGQLATAVKDVCKNMAGTQTSVPSGYTQNSAGSCVKKATTSTPGAPATTTVGAVNLKNWKLTLPVGKSGDPTEIKNTNLATYKNAPWYSRLSDGQTIFYVDSKRATATTSNSDNPRSELREMSGSKEASWSSTSGTHQLLTRLKVTQLQGTSAGGKTFGVVISQIHDANDDVTVFRLEGKKLWVTKGDEPHGYLVDGNVKIGQIITVGFKVEKGVTRYYYSNTGSMSPSLISYSLKQSYSGGYFKAGNYCQCGGGRTGKTKIVISGLGVTHNGKLPDIGGN